MKRKWHESKILKYAYFDYKVWGKRVLRRNHYGPKIHRDTIPWEELPPDLKELYIFQTIKPKLNICTRLE